MGQSNQVAILHLLQKQEDIQSDIETLDTDIKFWKDRILALLKRRASLVAEQEVIVNSIDTLVHAAKKEKDAFKTKTKSIEQLLEEMPFHQVDMGEPKRNEVSITCSRLSPEEASILMALFDDPANWLS